MKPDENGRFGFNVKVTVPLFLSRLLRLFFDIWDLLLIWFVFKGRIWSEDAGNSVQGSSRNTCKLSKKANLVAISVYLERCIENDKLFHSCLWKLVFAITLSEQSKLCAVRIWWGCIMYFLKFFNPQNIFFLLKQSLISENYRALQMLSMHWYLSCAILKILLLYYFF